ncbi:uncharacterized protein LOC129570218 [Sitodiplosis mosellana]|uniref:uncharacterized protein LOC129570218 n=1 Tax=Sitodiplosis mosellana TaxID=263140 RepID=UPI0024443BFB|nr:uncharacterized protein LOC129570218 [Sitodiplosis mosellana]
MFTMLKVILMLHVLNNIFTQSSAVALQTSYAHVIETSSAMSIDSDLNEDCEDIPPPTVVMNQELIVEHKYAYFHHDMDDVQQNYKDFVDADELDPIVLCSGDECRKDV